MSVREKLKKILKIYILLLYFLFTPLLSVSASCRRRKWWQWSLSQRRMSTWLFLVALLLLLETMMATTAEYFVLSQHPTVRLEKKKEKRKKEQNEILSRSQYERRERTERCFLIWFEKRGECFFSFFLNLPDAKTTAAVMFFDLAPFSCASSSSSSSSSSS